MGQIFLGSNQGEAVRDGEQLIAGLDFHRPKRRSN